MLWCKWISLNLPPLWRFSGAASRFLCPSFLPPPAPRSLHLHVIHPSSPSAQPYNQVFFMLFCKVQCESVLCSSSSPRLATSSPSRLPYSFALSLHISNVKTWGNAPLSWKHFSLCSIALHTAGLYVLASSECQFNTLLYTLRPFTLGSQDKSDCDRLPFFFITEIKHLSVY